jgi:hypothetical protein
MKRTSLVWVGLVALAAAGCMEADDRVGTGAEALSIKSQLRGYDLGPPFPAGFRDSGLVNGYAENQWVPFVAVMEGTKLEDADLLAGGAGDGRYGAAIIVPSYSVRHGANAIVDLQVSGTYGEGAITPIPDPFDAHWLEANGYQPFVLGAFADGGDEDLDPSLGQASQRSGPTRFGGEVGSASIPVEWSAPAGASSVELRFAVRLAPRGLEEVSPAGQGFGQYAAGAALGAADFFPGPGPIFVGYEVGKPTGIATVPIRVLRHSCTSDDECPSGGTCNDGGSCDEPCVDDSNCLPGEICEDGRCDDAPPPCETAADCAAGDVCIGGFCLPPCPEDGNDACTAEDDGACDAEACCGGYHDENPPCVADAQCADGNICDDGVCQPPTTPCDTTCPGNEECVDGVCRPPDHPCEDDGECEGGEVCVDGNCHTGEPPCEGDDCVPCRYDAECPGGEICLDGDCHPAEPPADCDDDSDCPDGQVCEGDWCDVPEPCSDDGDCTSGSVCDGGTDVCVPEHPTIECDDAGDCPSGDSCQGGVCVPPGGCDDDGDCEDGNVCDTSVDLCVPPHPPIPCDGAGDCPSGEACEGGWCDGDGGGDDGGGDQPCDNDLDCPSGVCDDSVDRCVPEHPPIDCDDDGDCPDGDRCAGGYCTHDSCEDDGDCASGTMCDSSIDLCVPEHPPVPCEGDADCPGDDACEAGWCVPPEPCDDDSDCPGGDVCDKSGSVDLCVPGQPPVPCETEADCPADACTYDDVGTCGPVCLGGYCQPGGDGGSGGCQDDGDCPGGYGCTSIGSCAPVQDPVSCDSQYDCGGAGCAGGYCVPAGDGEECDDASDCYGNDDVGNEQCIGGMCSDSAVDLRLCVEGASCPAGYECSGDTCARIEGACELDADCSDGKSCIGGWCDQACDGGGACGGPGNTCAIGRCVRACISYGECGSHEACVEGGCVARVALAGIGGSGDPSLWTVALPGGDVSGGCSAGGAGGRDGLGLFSMLMALFLVGRARRGPRRR